MNPAINIHHIRDGFERVKGDSDRQNEFGPLNGIDSENRQERIEILNEKIGILEVEQQTYVHGNRESQHQTPVQGAFGGRHPFDEMKINKRGAEDDEDEFRSAPAVEEDAEQQDGYVLELLGDQVIRDQKSRQESEKENDAAEYHIYLIIGAEDK